MYQTVTMHTSIVQRAYLAHSRAYLGCIPRTPVACRPNRLSRVQAHTVSATATKEDVKEVQESSSGGRKMDAHSAGLLSWEEIGERAGSDVLYGYQVLDNSSRKGQPRTAPTKVLPTEESTTTDKPVLLYRDTNAWCPFCERVRGLNLLASKQKPCHLTLSSA